MNKVTEKDRLENLERKQKTGREEERMKEKEDIKVMYVSLCRADVITSISRLAVNADAKRQKASLTLTHQHTHF